MNLHLRAVAACMLGCLCVGEAFAEGPREWIKADDHLKSLVQLYQEFHRHPELSLKEEKTAARYAEELRKVGFDVTTGVGGHGVGRFRLRRRRLRISISSRGQPSSRKPRSIPPPMSGSSRSPRPP